MLEWIVRRVIASVILTVVASHLDEWVRNRHKK